MAESAPSFLRGLFHGSIHDSLLFPYPASLETRDPDEARVVRKLIAALREMQGDGLIASAAFDEAETIPDDVIRAFADAGLLGITIPKEYGGLGLSYAGYARIFGEVATHDPSLGVVIGVHCGLGARAIVIAGSEEQKRRYLPSLASGETLAAYALTEPETGSDAQHIVTQARLSDDGSHWILNGRKHWIGLGHRAGVIATFAQTPVEKGGKKTQRPTAFILRPDMPGFRVVGTVRKMGIRGSTQAELAYENLQVPVDHVLGDVGKGFSVAVGALNGGRLSLAAGCAHGAKAIVREMVHYAEWREQFQAPLANFELTQRKFASIAADAYACDAMIGSLAAAMDDKTADVALEAACVKVFGSELIWRACDDMVQVAGGRGYVKPYPYERMMRDARINRIFEGANDVLRLFVGLNGIEGPSERLAEIGTALRSPIQNWNLVAGYATERVKGAFGATDRIDTVLHERLREHVRFFEKHVAELRTATDRAIMRYRKKIIERQLVVERLANMVTELYARATTLSRTQRFIDERGVDGCVRELQLCDLFCVESGRRFRASRVSLEGRWEQVDDTMRTVAASLRAAGSYFVEDAILEDSESLTSPNARGVKAYVDDLPRPVKKTSAVH